MVVQKTINSLKEKPKEERTVVAGGIAVTVVALLLVGWGFWFIKKVQRGEEFRTFIGSPQDQFNPANVREAQEVLEAELKQGAEQLRALREAVDPGTLPSVQAPEIYDPSNDQFGAPEDIF